MVAILYFHQLLQLAAVVVKQITQAQLVLETAVQVVAAVIRNQAAQVQRVKVTTVVLDNPAQ